MTTCQVSSPLPSTCCRYALRAGTDTSSLWAAFHWARVAPRPVSAGPGAAAVVVVASVVAEPDGAADLPGGAAGLLPLPEHAETAPITATAPKAATICNEMSIRGAYGRLASLAGNFALAGSSGATARGGRRLGTPRTSGDPAGRAP